MRYGGEIRNKKGCVGVDPVGGDGEIVSGEGGGGGGEAGGEAMIHYMSSKCKF